MDNDALDAVDQLECSVLAIFRCLRCLAPAAIENGVGRRNACRVGRILRSHDADESVDRAPGVAARERTNFRQRSLGHEQIRFRRTRMERSRKARYRHEFRQTPPAALPRERRSSENLLALARDEAAAR